MLPILSIEAKELCEAKLCLETRRVEPIGDAYWFDWQEVTEAAIGRKMNLDRFLTLNIAHFFAHKKFRTPDP